MQRAGLDRHDRLRRGQQSLLDRVESEPHGGLSRALGVARLQHVQPALIDRELGVLHVLVVALEFAQDLVQPRVDFGHPVGELGEVARRTHARDDVLALRVDQEVSARLGRAGDFVAREGHAGARRGSLVAVDHLLHVDRRAPIIGNPVDAPVGHRAISRPRVKDRVDGAVQLLARVLGEVVESLEACCELTQSVGVELSVEGDAELTLDLRDLLLEVRSGHATNDVTEHLHEPPVGVPGKPGVAGARRQSLGGGVAQAQVQDRVHHPGH